MSDPMTRLVTERQQEIAVGHFHEGVMVSVVPGATVRGVAIYLSPEEAEQVAETLKREAEAWRE